MYPVYLYFLQSTSCSSHTWCWNESWVVWVSILLIFYSFWSFFIVLTDSGAVGSWGIEIRFWPTWNFGSRMAILIVFSKRLRGWVIKILLVTCSVEYKWEHVFWILLLLSFFYLQWKLLTCMSYWAEIAIVNVEVCCLKNKPGKNNLNRKQNTR